MPDYALLTLASSLLYAVSTALQKHGIATRVHEFALADVFARFGELLAATHQQGRGAAGGSDRDERMSPPARDHGCHCSCGSHTKRRS